MIKELPKISFRHLVVFFLLLVALGEGFFLYKQNIKLNNRDRFILQLLDTIESTVAENDFIKSQPTPTPEIIFKYVEKIVTPTIPNTNQKKIKEIDKKISALKEEIEKIRKDTAEYIGKVEKIGGSSDPSVALIIQSQIARMDYLKHQVLELEQERRKYE